MFGPPTPRRPPSRRRRGRARTLLVTGTLVVGLLLLTLGVPSVSYTTAELTRSGNVPLVSQSNDADAAHGLDKHPTATNNTNQATNDSLVNVSNNFGTGSTNLGYRVRLLNRTSSSHINVSGQNRGDIYDFTLSSGDPSKKINISTAAPGGSRIKYSVNVTNRSLTANATRTINVTS